MSETHRRGLATRVYSSRRKEGREDRKHYVGSSVGELKKGGGSVQGIKKGPFTLFFRYFVVCSLHTYTLTEELVLLYYFDGTSLVSDGTSLVSGETPYLSV